MDDLFVIIIINDRKKTITVNELIYNRLFAIYRLGILKKDDVLSFFVDQTKVQSNYRSHSPSNVCWQ